MTTETVRAGAPRILVVGNYTCANRGDAAILRGLLSALAEAVPDAEPTITSRFPVVSAHILGRPVEADRGDLLVGTVRRRRLRALLETCLPHWLGAATRWRWLAAPLPGPVRAAIAELRSFDLVVQVGGSNFVDHYGGRHYVTPFLSMLAGRRLLLLGQSMGPFRPASQRRLARWLIEGSSVVALREPASLALLHAAGLPTTATIAGADTAWLVPPPQEAPDRGRTERTKLTIGVSLRDLEPFGADLGITQARYEAAFAGLADALIAEGHTIVALSTATGIGSYHRDDRMPALRVRAQLQRPEQFRIVFDELDDVEIGERLQCCDLVVATRLHCAIIAMNFGVPAIALNYEHKSAGVLRQLGLDRLALPLSSLFDGSLRRTIDTTIEDLPAVRAEVAAAVERERERARHMVRAALDIAARPS